MLHLLQFAWKLLFFNHWRFGSTWVTRPTYPRTAWPTGCGGLTPQRGGIARVTALCPLVATNEGRECQEAGKKASQKVKLQLQEWAKHWVRSVCAQNEIAEKRLWVLQAVLGSPHTRSRRALPGGAIWLPQAGRAALTQLVAASWPFSGTAVLWCRYCNPSEMHRYLSWKLNRKEVSLGKQQNNLCSSSRGKISTWRYLAAAN